MSITELLSKAKVSASRRTRQDRHKILIEAKIITSRGTYNTRYFSKKTIEENKKTNS